MTTRFPDLSLAGLASARDVLHDASRIAGDWLKVARPRRKHWWHASLRPALNGVTTGVIRGAIDSELSLDFSHARVELRDARGALEQHALNELSALELAEAVSTFLVPRSGLQPPAQKSWADRRRDFDVDDCAALGQALAALAGELETFRASVREECSPVQLWPHHFDLSMIWLPGDKVPGVDPADEESADRQMNFGFSFGDDGIREPYLYVTAYPRPAWVGEGALPAGASWHAEGFEGALLTYADLRRCADPSDALQSLWRSLLNKARAAS